MKQNYDDDCRKLYQIFLLEATHWQTVLDKQTRYYENAQFSANEQILDTHETLDEEFKDIKVKVVSKEIDRRDQHKANIDLKMNQITEIIQNILNVYKTTAAEPKRMAVFNRMAMNVACFAVNMDDKYRKCDKEIIKLNKKLTELELTVTHKLQTLTRERNDLIKRCWTLKETVKQLGKFEKLNELAGLSIKELKFLENKINSGEKLVKLGILCTRLEYPEERMMKQLKAVTKATNEINILQSMEDLLCSTELSGLGPMGIFWNKISQVTLKRNRSREEKKVLAQENDQLKICLKEYCTQGGVLKNLNMLGYGQYIRPTVKQPAPTQEASVIPQIRRRLDAKKRVKLVRKPYAMVPNYDSQQSSH